MISSTPLCVMTFSAIADLTMMTETDDPSPIFSSPDRIPPDDSLSTTDEIGTGDDLQQSREEVPNLSYHWWRAGSQCVLM